jgi:ubiquinone/menaquinone biosynthesis C-methylase UbiE
VQASLPFCINRLESVTVASLNTPDYDTKGPDNLRSVKADGPYLPFADKSFDWVFSDGSHRARRDWDRLPR